MLSPIDHRLLASWEHRQIEIVARTDAIAAAVGGIVARERLAMVRATIGASADYATYETLRRLYAGIVPKVREYLDAAMRSIVRYSDANARKLIASIMPRSWWRVIYPTLAEAAPAGGRDPLDRLFGKQNVGFNVEPVLKGQGNMSDDAFRRAVEKVLLPPLTEKQVEDIVKSPNPHTGDTWQKRLTDLSAKVQSPERVAAEIVTGMATGENVDQLTQRIDRHVGKLNGSSRRIARTEARRVAEAANRETLKQSLGDLLDGWQITEVLDERTRPHHAARHGTVYRKGGDPPFEDAPELPDEPNCRGTLIPVLKTPQQIAQNPAVAQVFKNATGSRIPDPAAYSQWFRGTDERRKRLAVGSRRFDIVRKQKQPGQQPEWEDFIGEDGRLIPAVDLKTQTATAAAERTAKVRAMLLQREADFVAITQAPFIPTVTAPPASLLPAALTILQKSQGTALSALSTRRQQQFLKLASRIVAGQVRDTATQLELAKGIVRNKPDAELWELLDQAVAMILAASRK